MPFQRVLEEIHHEVAPHFGKGRVADYIPALASADPRKFGMAVASVDGSLNTVGDAEEKFSIQSISKVFTLMIALSRYGDEVWTRVGKEPSGTKFNSLVQLELEKGVPRNPFINAGALVVSDMLATALRRPKELIRDYARVLSRNFDLDFDEEVAKSELATAHVNAALAHLMKSHGHINSSVETLLDVYCHQCALSMSCVDLARAFLPLAGHGHSPLAAEAVLTERQAKRINALMLTCGFYDSVGSFAYRVGLPGKSGVGGGIACVMPGEFAVTVWSPELDRSGNSYVGSIALELFARFTRRSIF
jgi:glutaminase